MKTLCILLGLLTSTAVFSQNEKKQLNTQNTADFLVDKKASPETLALFYNLKQTAQKGFAIGQQDAFNGFYSNKKGKSDIKKTTGTDPAVIGLDFSFITDNKNTGQSGNWHYEQEQKIISYTKKAYNKGMIISYCWHFREPYKGEEFYVDQMTEIQKNAVQSILPNGENHEYYKTKLDKIAATAKKLIGSDGKLIPVIFRPFHEFDGSWFWWGADFCSVQQYIELYQFTVKYLRDTKGVTNFLYAFSPDNRFSNTEEYLQRYPGDSYVDLLGMDNYGDFDNKGEQGIKMANEKLKILSDLAKQRNKIAAMTETGYQITDSKKPIEKFFSKNIYDSLTQNNLEISYVLFWGNSQNGYFVPPPNEPDTADFIEFTKKTKSVLLNKLPSMYKMPKK